MEPTNTRPCAVRDCSAVGVVWDDKYDTKLLLDPEILRPNEYWLCTEHAVEYLFPIIDNAVGYTTDAILRDFKEEGMLG